MNNQLLDNIQQQTKRLVQQLNELEELKGDLEPEEYEATKNETLNQLEEFEKMLKNMQSGDITLLNAAQKAQLEIQSAIKKSFNTQEIMEGFSSKEAGTIRDQIKTLERNLDLGKISKEEYIKQTLSLINKLDELKTTLTASEKEFLDKYTGKTNFVDAGNQDVEGKKLFQEARTQFADK